MTSPPFLSPVSRFTRYHNQPEVKFEAFSRQENLIRNVFFSIFKHEQYEDLIKQLKNFSHLKFNSVRFFIFQQNSLIENCVFKERHNVNGYSSFESRPHSGWYMALTNDGRAKPGPKTAPSQRAVEFLPGKI